MSTGRGSGAGNGAGAQPIPAGLRKVVQSLKEIVNCPDAEIYAILKDSNMDPNETVNRLLSQDPFHEVKRKREKKKEGKDNFESRSHSTNNSSNRGNKSVAERNVGRSSAPHNVSESPLRGKATHKKENGSTPYTSYLSSASGSGINRSRGSSGISDDNSAESKGSLTGMANEPSAVLPASGYQSAWVGVPGQVSMADIVRMGKSHNKTLNAPNVYHHNIQDPSPTELLHEQRFTEDHTPEVHQPDEGWDYIEKSAISHVPTNEGWDYIEKSAISHVPTNEGWDYIEKSAAANHITGPEYTVESEPHLGASGASFDSVNLLSNSEEVQERENDDTGSSGGNDVESISITSRKVQEDELRGASIFGNDLHKSRGRYECDTNDFVQQEDEEADASVSSVTRNLQRLSVEKDERGFTSEGHGNVPSVVIPDHLQVHTADCSHLSFGSFGSGVNAVHSSGTVTSLLTKNNLDLAHSDADISSVGHSDTRHSEHYVDDSLRNAPNGSLFHRTAASAGSYDASSTLQLEELKTESAELADGNQYSFPSSNPGYAFDDTPNLAAAFNQTSFQMQNLTPFSNIMHPNANLLPRTLLTANVHPTRESELHHPPLPVTQSMNSKYGNAVSSIGVSAISLSEALRTAGSPSTPPDPQTLSGTSVATGPPLPQHLALHPYSQPTLPLGPYANMIGYPFLPQSYAYMPSAFPQSLAGSSTYHQSLGSILPQYKSSVSVSSLPQSAAVASGYDAFGSTMVPGNYPMNPPAAPSGSSLSYDDVLSSQYKGSSHLLPLHQNENLAARLHGGPNSRTMPSVSGNTYDNYQGRGQNLQLGGLRQGQQQSLNYGPPGYLNFYHSQSGVMHDQQQNPRDGLRTSPQGQPKQSQIWPNGY